MLISSSLLTLDEDDLFFNSTANITRSERKKRTHTSIVKQIRPSGKENVTECMFCTWMYDTRWMDDTRLLKCRNSFQFLQLQEENIEERDLHSARSRYDTNLVH